jgi:oxygen-independent coproporphyrinogen-3 oxidase
MLMAEERVGFMKLAVAPCSPSPPFRTPGAQPLPLRPAFTVLPPLALYVHMPWCVRKCPYCDFNSHALREGLPEDDYLEALTRDLEAALPWVEGRPIQTVFIGGGTPSLFSAATIAHLVDRVQTLLHLESGAEITLEANPGTFDAKKFRDFRKAGVTRLSLGVQSFHDRHLEALGRIHDASQARAAVDSAGALFDTFNVDLMYGLPGQTVEEAVADIDTAIACGVPHVSAYQLSIEPHTLFHAHPPVLPDEDTVARIEEEIEAHLARAGYTHYETSAYARGQHQCRHNLNYWRFGDYLGIGAGAHGKLTFSDGVVRHARFKQPKAYMAAASRGDSVETVQRVEADALPFEFMMNALRLVEGFSPALFEERTGLPLAAVEATLVRAEAQGLLARTSTCIRATHLGRRFLNDLIAFFLPD